MKMSNVVNAGRRFAANTGAKVAAGATAMIASGAAMASPGAAIAAELTGGKADMLLVVAAVAVLLGCLIVWGYIKRTK